MNNTLATRYYVTRDPDPHDDAHWIPWQKVSDRIWTSGRRFVIDFVPDPEPRFRLFDNAEFVGQFNELAEAQAHAEEL